MANSTGNYDFLRHCPEAIDAFADIYPLLKQLQNTPKSDQSTCSRLACKIAELIQEAQEMYIWDPHEEMLVASRLANLVLDQLDGNAHCAAEKARQFFQKYPPLC